MARRFAQSIHSPLAPRPLWHLTVCLCAVIPTASAHIAAGAGAAPTPKAAAPTPSDDGYEGHKVIGNTGTTEIGDDGSAAVVNQTGLLPLPVASASSLAHSPPAVEPLQQPRTSGACSSGFACFVRTLAERSGHD